MADFEKIINRIETCVIIIGFGWVVYSVWNVHQMNVKRDEVIRILDTNRDGKLSDGEVRRFYDEIGITPYNLRAFNLLPKEDLEKFLSLYSGKNPEKR